MSHQGLQQISEDRQKGGCATVSGCETEKGLVDTRQNPQIITKSVQGGGRT